MCGITGIVRTREVAFDVRQAVQAMSVPLRHRGPDDEGIWTEPDGSAAFGFRRLAIIDLTSAGHQPMASASGRWVIVFNGEIFNYLELRERLIGAGVCFKGHSDTEVILEAVALWGVQKTVSALVGMFAIALWDRQDRSLTLVRDRIGIKPLYWGQFNGSVAFASELKAFTTLPGWTPAVDRSAMACFLRYGYISGPATIYQGVRRLEPGTMMRLAFGGEPAIERYWDLKEIATTSRTRTSALDEAEAEARLEALMKDAVRRRMISDVPLGAFLSGGVDSSTVVALMQLQSSQPVKTFSIGFENAAYDEAPRAKRIARHLGTDHTELYVSGGDAMAVVPALPDLFDEPFADQSQIPTYLVCAMARRHVTVALSGDGGDELFAGYPRYAVVSRIARIIQSVPKGARLGVANAIKFISGLGPADINRKLGKFADTLSCAAAFEVHQRMVSQWNEPRSILDLEPESDWLRRAYHLPVSDLMGRLQLTDMLTYLPDDILAKVDRASMAVGLEARVPCSITAWLSSSGLCLLR